MLSRDQLDQAVQTGIIGADQRDRLIALANGQANAETGGAQTAPVSVDENMRLIGGGNDVFVTIGIVMLGAGLYAAIGTMFAFQTALVFGILAAAAWLLAEFVTRQHRMRLSSTVLGVAFMICIYMVLGGTVQGRFDLSMPENPLQLAAMRPQMGLIGTLLFGGVAAVAVIYFWRFKVPIMAAVIALALTALIFFYGTLFLYDGVTEGRLYLPALEDLPELLRSALYLPLVAGLVIFAVGVAFDLHDRDRVTVWSDCAFWLHVISAPLLVHPLFILSTGQEVVFGEIEPSAAAMTMIGILIAVFLYVALAIDRRSLLIPALAYFGTLGIYYLINSAANQTGIPPFALILLVVGALIMVFGAGWQRIRSLIIQPTLPNSLLDRLPTIRA